MPHNQIGNAPLWPPARQDVKGIPLEAWASNYSGFADLPFQEFPAGSSPARPLRVLLLINLASTLMMTGLIWFVQIVHYPLFARADRANFSEFAKQHSRLTSLVVGPLMLAEAASAVALLFSARSAMAAALLALVVVIWVSTAGIQVPCHTRLEGGFDAAVHRRLVRSNWIRTVAWSLRSALTLFWVWRTNV